jgi:hypothetical protein
MVMISAIRQSGSWGLFGGFHSVVLIIIVVLDIVLVLVPDIRFLRPPPPPQTLEYLVMLPNSVNGKR